MGFVKIDEIKINDRIFLDREDILKTIEKYIIEYKEKEHFYKLITFRGVGGIGKSRLINQIYNLYNGTDIFLYKYHLEILNHETIPSVLLHIRKDFSYTPHFDYVLFRYWDFVNYNRVNIDILDSIAKKTLLRIVDKIDNLFFSGVLELEETVRKIIGIYEKREINEKEKELVANLLQGKVEDLYQYMAQALAKDIEKEIISYKFLFIFDAYDKQNITFECDWLKYFINAFNNGLFIVTSREGLDWFDNVQLIDGLVENISINTIPPDIIKEYLLEHDFKNDQIDLIIEKTDCIPLFLDIALNFYKENEINKNSFIGFRYKTDLIKHLLNHLSADEQNIIEYLSVIEIFNEEIYNSAVFFNNLSIQTFHFNNFKKSTIIRYTEEFNGLYKIHSILANNIAYFVDIKISHEIIKTYIDTICKRILLNENLYDDIKYTLIKNVYFLAEKYNLSIDKNISEKLLDMLYYLLDSGYINDFAIALSNNLQKEDSTLKYIYQYINGLNKRMCNIMKGLKILECIPIDKCNFGKHTKSLQCDINYLLSISGQYKKAEKKMIQFARNLNSTDYGERYYSIGILYDCDMKMLRGKFKTSVAEMTVLLNNISNNKERHEIQKAIGHNYRFNFLLDTALDKYYTYKNMGGSMAYYYTVYCETNCYMNPQLVLNIYKKAIEENKKYDNHNNLGKIYYSLAIVYILNKDYIKAINFIKFAYNEFKSTKYYAGKIFVMITAAYLTYSKEKKLPTETISKIKKYMEKLDGIYEYLLLPLYVATKDIKKIQEYKEIYEWISFDETINNIISFINLL